MALLQPKSQGAADISPDGKIAGTVDVIPDSSTFNPDTTQADQTADGAGGQQQQDAGNDDFSFDAFSAAKGLEIKEDTKPIVTQKGDKIVTDEEAEAARLAKEVAKPKLDTQEDLDKPQPKVTVTKQGKQYPDKRDYTGIEPELVPHFKNMSNDAFAAMKPLLLTFKEDIKKKSEEITNLKQGKVIIPDSYYEHERAYMLTPEFEEAVVNANEAQTVYNHWTQQLNEVRQGAKTFKSLTRDAQGKLAYGADMAADASAETKLMGLFNTAHNQLLQFNGKLSAVKESYKGNYAQAQAWVTNLNDNTFTAFKDDKSPMGIAAKEYVNKTLPAAFRNNPLANSLARSLITTAEMYKLLVVAKQQLDAKGNGKGAGKVILKAELQPTNSDMGNDGGGGGSGAGQEAEVSMDDFNRVKAL